MVQQKKYYRMENISKGGSWLDQVRYPVVDWHIII